MTQDVLARLFRKFNGMEYCDLKKDPATGRSKVRIRREPRTTLGRGSYLHRVQTG